MAAVLSSLSKLEGELQKAIAEVRSQVSKLEASGEETPVANNQDDLEAPPILQRFLDDGILEVNPLAKGAPRALRQAATLMDPEETQLQLSPHFMELSIKSGGALNATTRLKEMVRAQSTRSSSRPGSLGLNDLRAPGVLMPHGRKRVCWDTLLTGLILLDVLIVPLSLAWDFETTPIASSTEPADVVLQIIAFVHLVCWPVDILLNFNTGFYAKGQLVLRRPAIAMNYSKGWFLFDLAVVGIDWVSWIPNALGDGGEGFLKSLRSARYLRALRSARLLRLAKTSKLNVMLENYVIAMGRQWLILAFNVMKMLGWIGLTAHLLACTWFGVGMLVSQSRESWVDLAMVSSSEGHVQYIHALAWIIQPPSPPEMGVLGVNSFAERCVSILLVIVTVLVIGSALSILTGTVQEIRTINNERSRKRRELRTYLHSQSAPTELVMRIMSFADYKLERHSPISYDAALVSPLLEAELAVWQTGHLMEAHPLFNLTRSMFPKVFADICCALQKHLFYEGESAFLTGILASSMYITNHGTFKVWGANSADLFSNEKRFFSEVALYVDGVMHDCTLEIGSFAEVYSLEGKSIAAALMNSPICASMFVEYAKEFMAVYARSSNSVCQQSSLNSSHISSVSSCLDGDMKVAKQALRANSLYMDTYLEPSKMLNNMKLRPKVKLDLIENQSLPDDLVASEAGSFVTLATAGKAMCVCAKKLYESYIELDPEEGLHALHSESLEQEKAESACLCLAALVADDYEGFTSPQKEHVKLQQNQWQQFREILAWAAPTQDVLDAAFFLLAVRSIGKYRTIRRQLGPNLQRPETVLMHIIEFYPNVVPTTRGLSDSAHDLLIKSLELQLAFQFPQMLQGENVPANLSQLQLFLREKGGEQTLKFYVVFLLGFLSGLQGGRGSAFMTASNAKNILLGLHTVQHILDKKPAYLYWTYIYQRGLLLQRVARSLEDLALCRLACLCRVRSSQEFQQLEESWFQLDDWQQEVLTSHFLASGINNTAIVFEFLPLCLERAKGNPQVGVPCLLEILVGLVEAVLAGSERGQKQNIMTVDLSNLGAFILLVQNRFVFQTCLARSKLRKRNNPHEFHLDLTEDNWSRVNERQTDLVAVSDTVREILHAQRNKPMPLLCV